MKYLLYYVDEGHERNTVQTEKYDNFEDAIRRYTLMCACRDHVVLADAEKEVIVRQYAFRYFSDAGTSLCIF